MSKAETTTLPLEGMLDEPREAPVAGSNPVATREPGSKQGSQAVALGTQFTPPELLQLAIIKKSDISVIERLAALAERWQETADKRRARIAFVNALVDAKAEMPSIKKNRHVQFESRKPGASDTDYWHEDLAEVVETATPVLAKHGLHFRWRTEQPGEGKVKITCILEHREGHAEENDLSAGVDLSGNKNHIQAIKSAATYLERITALASVGLAARGQDDDGRAGGIKQESSDFPGDRISDEQVSTLMDKCDAVGCSHEHFLKWAGVEMFSQIRADQFDSCMQGLAQFKPAKTRR